MPCVVQDAFIQSFSFRISGTGPFRLNPVEIRFMPVFRSDGTFIDYLQNLVIARWDAGDIPDTPGEHKDIPVTNEETFIKTSGQLYNVSITVRAVIGERLHFGQLPIEDTSGLKDELTDGYMTTSFTTAKISFADVEKTWEPISSIQQLSVKPMLTLRVKSMPPRFEGTAPPTQTS
jgi:hypothetical protein